MKSQWKLWKERLFILGPLGFEGLYQDSCFVRTLFVKTGENLNGIGKMEPFSPTYAVRKCKQKYERDRKDKGKHCFIGAKCYNVL